MHRDSQKALAAVLLVAALVVSACGKTGPVTCASPDAVSVTSDLVRDQIVKSAIAESKDESGSQVASDASIRAAVNVFKISVDAIRTTKEDPNSTKRFCTGTIKVIIPINTINDADRARSLKNLNSVNDFAQTAGIERSADTFSFPMDWDVQPTDDHKMVYAEIQGMDPQLHFFGELALSSILKTQFENQARQEQAAQQQQQAFEQQQKQQASQAVLEEAQAENKLSNQSIAAVWQSIDPDTRARLLDLQRAWIKEKEANCNIQAAGASTDPTEKETARLKCDTGANQQRQQWLQQYTPR